MHHKDEDMCANCKKGNGYFKTCRTLKSFRNGLCANCLSGGDGTARCSFISIQTFAQSIYTTTIMYDHPSVSSNSKHQQLFRMAAENLSIEISMLGLICFPSESWLNIKKTCAWDSITDVSNIEITERRGHPMFMKSI